MAEKLEVRLKREGRLTEFNDEFQGFLDRGAIREVTNSELENYDGPVQYVSHHPVFKEGTGSTRLRIVSNSSLPNSGSSLNDCLPKGPNNINDAFKVLVNFRSYTAVLVLDISKAYQQMHTSSRDTFVRLMVWKLDPGGSWKTYGFITVTFGDRPAAILLELAIHLCAEEGKSICSEDAEKLKTDRYVDDVVTGGEEEDVDRMMGKQGQDGTYDGTLQQILGLGGFKKKGLLKVRLQ